MDLSLDMKLHFVFLEKQSVPHFTKAAGHPVARK